MGVASMTHLRVRELAEQQEMSITDLHMKTGIAYSNVARYWHDQVGGYQKTTLDRLAQALGVRVGDLFGGEPAPADPTGPRRRRLKRAS